MCIRDSDYPAALMALGAVVHTSKRKIPADEFFSGMFSTALDEDEVITKVAFPIPGKAAYVKFPNPASRYAIVGVFVAKKGGPFPSPRRFRRSRWSRAATLRRGTWKK